MRKPVESSRAKHAGVLAALSLALLSAACLSPARADAVNGTPHHVGNNTDATRWDPAAPDGVTFSWRFNMQETGNLSEIRFSGVSDIEAGTAFSVDGNSCGFFIFPCQIDPAEVRLFRGGNQVYTGTLDSNGTVSLAPDIAVNPGNFTLEVEAGPVTLFGSTVGRDDFDWDRIDVMVSPPGGGGGSFNAVTPGEDPVSGDIHTQVAGRQITLDIAALNNQGDALRNNYNGDVTVELIDAVDNSGTLDSTTGCRSTWGQSVVVTLGTVSFAGNTGNPQTVTFPAYAEALREARIRLQGTQGGGGGGGSVRTACSTDAFAVRPDSFGLQVTDQDPANTGAVTLDATTATGTPIHPAGADFHVTATALNAGGATTTAYDGTPAASVDGSVLGATAGTLTTGAWSTANGEASNAQVSYSEVGAFRLAVEDATFASVDDGDGSTAAERTVGPVTVDVGRFVPADFTIALANSPQLEAQCPAPDSDAAFTYLGQPFAYRAGARPQVDVTAVNAAAGVTTNYTGALFKLTPASVTGQSYPVGGGHTISVLSPPLPPPDSVTDNGDGSGTFTFTVEDSPSTPPDGIRVDRPAAPVAAFEAEIALEFSVTDQDGVAYSGNPARIADTTAGNGIGFWNGDTPDNVPQADKTMRYGRLRLVNAYGSEKLPLPVPVRVEYWDASLGASGGFVRSAGDVCTDGSAVDTGADVTLDESQLNGGSTSVNSLTIDAGEGALELAAPDPGRGKVGVDLDLTAGYPWLEPDSDGDGSFDDSATATASFGLYRGDDRRIYLRETVPP